jgi:Domain of unknown function (DUF4411)
VIDTSSVIRSRDLVQGETQQKIAFAKLDGLVHDGVLVYPPQVVTELDRYATKDLPFRWAKRNEGRATRFVVTYAEVQSVLAVARVIDPSRAGGAEEADPYVIALAKQLKDRGCEVTVLTDDFDDIPNVKYSLATGCGLLQIPVLRAKPFLAEQKIWPKAAT